MSNLRHIDGTVDQWKKIFQVTCSDQVSIREANLPRRWQRDRFVTSWWTPKRDDKQTERIEFEVFAGFHAPDESILDVYGTMLLLDGPFARSSLWSRPY